MPSWSSHLERSVDNAVTSYVDVQVSKGIDPLPIDPNVLAQGIGNIDVEEREMIPEAAIAFSASRFRIFLQCNFKDRPGKRARRRFSLAHEIAHTFFLEAHDGILKPMSKGPRGMDLESACHEGASRLLIPERFLRKEWKDKPGGITGEDILRLTKVFDVSIEVMLRRLRNEPLLGSDEVCFAFCRLGKIVYAMYPPWLGELLGQPAKTTVQKWFRTSEISLRNWFDASGLRVETLPNGSFIGSGEPGTLSARRVRNGASNELFEIRRYSAHTSHEEVRSRLLA